MAKAKFLTIITLASALTAGCVVYNTARDKVTGIWNRPFVVIITNLTDNIHMTPFLVVGHGARDSNMFAVGKPASAALQAVAEGGSLDLMVDFFAKEQIILNPAEGLLAPGASVEIELAENTPRLSLIAMILPTNDGFVAIDNVVLEPGTINLFAYDAGTEANDEAITGGGAPNTPGIPADPSRLGDMSAPGISEAKAEGSVQRHLGIQGGVGSALTVENNNWSGPIASVTIVRVN